MGTRSVPRQADERRTAAEKGMHVAGASGRGAGTVPAVTSDATQSMGFLKAGSAIQWADHVVLGSKPRASLYSPWVPGSKCRRPWRIQYSIPW